jgi:RecA-family ATPase
MNNNITSGSPGKEEPVTWTTMAKVVAKITWAWLYWLANGFVAIIAGSSGSGKSMLVLRICGCFTNGWDWPDGTPFEGDKGSVLWCEGEAAQAINLERARQYGLDMSRFITPFEDPLQDVDLDDQTHRARIKQMAQLPEVKLIVIDSLRGVNGQDENSSNINQMIKFLAEIARDTGKIVILTHHLRKKGIVIVMRWS